ncbi:MAG: hypothetical protein NC037_01095 [Bacteroides sp.]|nr:hypothetical protein [Bacillota bacterium]MCM1393519.1 hypothetical protein [[Eubacterium] siraeum]MCM1455112.1 hypothetical protein [Bacteroides sp.]
MKLKPVCVKCEQNYKCINCHYDCCNCPMGECTYIKNSHGAKETSYDKCKKPVYHTIGPLPKV